MTGQDYYDRFEKELGADDFQDMSRWMYIKVLEAAKRASNITEESNG